MSRRTLQCLLAEHGFSDEPVGGCPVGSDVASTAEISSIVQSMVVELQKRGML
jgi:2-dehydro-3-deoxy-D-pentonate aldolase